MGKGYVISTISGSRYKVLNSDDGTCLERIPSKEGSILRKDKKRIRIYKILQLTLGKPTIFVLEPLGIGNVTVRKTTMIIEIKTINN
ncbi:hypothetical protein BFR40_11970 [Brochothrix thermosphacta]|uniref:hypothetical protein n=1 Tax=Brochothrix thermosphacta TaxID=2756 RepID=UPI00083FBCDA|nr:hypothetical protein [Brochothrix thermosphacta]ODJ49417.1 hypothetical protein BFR40_11970 [Brochothrix thermosphacta]